MWKDGLTHILTPQEVHEDQMNVKRAFEEHLEREREKKVRSLKKGENLAQ